MRVPAVTKSLTGRLVATAVALVALVSVLVVLATALVMDQYLTSRLDQQVHASLDRAVNPDDPSHYINVNCFVFPNPSTRFGNAGRNSLIGPGVITADVALIKNIRTGGPGQGSHLQLRAEMFNLANRANFAAPLTNNKLFDAKGAPVSFAGQITSLSTPPRQLQLGLKWMW